MRHTPVVLRSTYSILARCRMARLNAILDGRKFPRIPFVQSAEKPLSTGVFALLDMYK